jgi:uncharacterized protein (DUF983 family)
MSGSLPLATTPATVRWTPDRAPKPPAWPTPPMVETLLRGFLGRCPCCGKGNIFGRFLKVVPECSNCHAPLGLIRADDLPPYLNIFIVGHIVVIGMLLLEQAASPPLWVHTAIWIPLTLALSFGLMQPVKGAVVGLMMKLDIINQEPESLGGDA